MKDCQGHHWKTANDWQWFPTTQILQWSRQTVNEAQWPVTTIWKPGLKESDYIIRVMCYIKFIRFSLFWQNCGDGHTLYDSWESEKLFGRFWHRLASSCSLRIAEVITIVGSFKGFSMVFLLSDWLKLNHLKSRMECGFFDTFRALFVPP